MSELRSAQETKTALEVQNVLQHCRGLFEKKLHDYGASWRIMRTRSLTDQIYIKANRIRSIEENGDNRVGEDIVSEFIGIVNYGIIALIQLQRPPADEPDIDEEEALRMYDAEAQKTAALLANKNHDYGEAWRQMRISSYVDLILTKIYRTKQIEDLGGKTLVSEGIDANYMDMINYSIFALIQLNVWPVK
ncbi:hypothetical protein HR11_01645 [Porphyromonas macacae]|uniref:Nucleotide modification associated domain-containing protein n=1 Tax=Porphyromonas macacae TaxID=28115 RepID=A0A0A2GDN9_9PORP|nr:DUF1599 domain-containing protein [Porphyromonas macacae]KGN76469.1 hypothetical protein HQ47_00030 [Porphyromonas macacae]KGO00583.1 hypothetical protein HR11_01645 [Porphyromonas macacae]